jgi:ubiquinone biosynthesis protein COQ4
MEVGHRLHPLLALRAFRALRNNPDDTAQVFIIANALRGKTALRATNRFRATEVGRAVLAEKRSLLPVLCNRAALAALPAGSLGRAYYDFVEKENISAQGLVEASDQVNKGPLTVSADEMLFRERVREMHDLWHVLTGYGRDPLGEVSVVAFSYAQTRLRGFAAIAFLGMLNIGRHLPGQPVRSVVFEAYRHGRAAAWLPAQDWEALLGEQLENLRARLGIAPPGRYRDVIASMRGGWASPATGS